MAEVSVATPGSTAESGTPSKQSAAKDRPCPYCSTRFTSSSLGRHLDLYIKEKNPKPPDGVHDVEQIRKTRGNITRRQARTSSAKREDSITSSAKPTIMQHQRSPSMGRHYTNGDHAERLQTRLNAANWQATGVINDIPSTPTDEQVRYEVRRDQARRLSSKNELAQRQRAIEERDRGRAAELALREVLDSVRAANVRAHDATPLDFDIFSQSFPALCLHCLSIPPSIVAQQPSPNSPWPMKPPCSAQYDSLRHWLDGKLEAWRVSMRANQKTSNASPLVMNGEVQPETGLEEKKIVYHEHLANAFKDWDLLSETQKQESWHLESLRAYAHEQKQHNETRARLERIDQETQNLRNQVDRLNKLQQPPEFLLFPPTTLPISYEVASTLPSGQWSYDQLVSKWKSRIQNHRSIQKSLPIDFSNPGATNQHHRLNGSLSRPAQNINGDSNPYLQDSSDDLIDAPGDEDDDMHLNEGRAVMDRGMLDPKLRDQGVDEVMQGIEGDEDGDGEGRLLVGLRDFQNMNERGLAGRCDIP